MDSPRERSIPIERIAAGHREHGRCFWTAVGFVVLAALIIAGGAGCKTSPNSGVSTAGAPVTPIVTLGFDIARTGECWAKVCKLAEEWNNAIQAANRDNPMPQFTAKLSDAERLSRLESWAKRSRALQQTSQAFESGLTELPVLGVHKDLTEHVKLLHSAIPVWTARFEAEQRSIAELDEVVRTLGGVKGYLQGAKIFFGSIGNFFLDKANTTAESNAFRDGRAEIQKVPANIRKTQEEFERAEERLTQKLQAIANANIDLRNRLSVALGRDLPPIPLR